MYASILWGRISTTCGVSVLKNATTTSHQHISIPASTSTATYITPHQHHTNAKLRKRPKSGQRVEGYSTRGWAHTEHAIPRLEGERHEKYKCHSWHVPVISHGLLLHKNPTIWYIVNQHKCVSIYRRYLIQRTCNKYTKTHSWGQTAGVPIGAMLHYNKSLSCISIVVLFAHLE